MRPCIVVLLALVVGCAGAQKKALGPPEVAQRAFELASAGDWGAFEHAFVIPADVFRAHITPGYDGMDALRASYLSNLRAGFAALRGARSPVVAGVQDDGKHGVRGHIISLDFEDAGGGAKSEGFRIYDVGGRLYVWDLD